MTTKGMAVGLVVADMKKSVAFYQHLGLDFTSFGDDHEESDLVPGFKLMLDTESSIKSFTSSWAHPTGSPRAAVAFQFDTPAEVDAKFEELMDAGYQGFRHPWNAVWGQRYASVLDPDGNGVDLCATLPQ
jgi:catechol 2,3-dioxygenase-like lactoylglutathione lyase family enzyme